MESNKGTKTILIIEDERDMSEALNEVLTAAGYTTMVFHNSEAVLTNFPSPLPDLVLLDLFTHSIHGIHFLQRLRATPERENIPCIILTNIDADVQKEKADKLGVVHYLVKSDTSLEAVVTAVNEVLKSS